MAKSLTQFGSPKKGAGPRTALKGRVCEVVECSTVLSIYNELPVCSTHELPRLRRPQHRD